jgi:hypothetical protein
MEMTDLLAAPSQAAMSPAFHMILAVGRAVVFSRCVGKSYSPHRK